MQSLTLVLPDDVQKSLEELSEAEQQQLCIQTLQKHLPKKISSEDVITLYSDGASRGNPGAAAGGWVIKQENITLKEGSSILGIVTNNVAEYKALIAGLEDAKEYSPKMLQIRLDSELIVKQIRGEYKVKHPDMQPLYQEVIDLLTDIPDWEIAHVPRAENARADALANAALDRK